MESIIEDKVKGLGRLLTARVEEHIRMVPTSHPLGFSVICEAREELRRADESDSVFHRCIIPKGRGFVKPL